MKKLLIVAATPYEIEPLRSFLQNESVTDRSFVKRYVANSTIVDVAITGPGISNTSFFLGQMADGKYNLAVNAGVCGSFRDDIRIGDVVNVERDCFSDMGAQDDESYLSFSEIGLGNEKVLSQFPIISNNITRLKKCSGITVNTVHGNNAAITKIVKRLDPDIESMEGAAFLNACNFYKWPSVQIRAISNKVEKRNKENWNMPLAIKNLNDFLIQFIKEV